MFQPSLKTFQNRVLLIENGILKFFLSQQRVLTKMILQENKNRSAINFQQIKICFWQMRYFVLSTYKTINSQQQIAVVFLANTKRFIPSRILTNNETPFCFHKTTKPTWKIFQKFLEIQNSKFS